jgi:hypothetical protein
MSMGHREANNNDPGLGDQFSFMERMRKRDDGWDLPLPADRGKAGEEGYLNIPKSALRDS